MGWSVPNLDYSWIGRVGNTVAGTITDYQDKRVVEDAWAKANGDYNVAVKALLEAGRPELALKVARLGSISHHNEMSPYERARIDVTNRGLDIREQELKRGPSDKIGSVVERIRDKLARGETLSAGEQKVYDDTIRKDPLSEMLKPQPGQSVPGVPGVRTMPGVEPPQEPQTSNLPPLSFPPLPITPQATQASAVADPRGAYFPEQGAPQGMSRQAAPDGTVITNGTKRLRKENGQWVPL